MQILFSGAVPTAREPRGVKGLLAVLDPDSGEMAHRCEYTTPAELQAPRQKMQLTGYSFIEDRLYVCSHTEIVVFDEWPPRAPVNRLSLPSFNDLHHCIPWEGGLAVANTGLETVDLISFEGELMQRWDVLSPEERARSPIDETLDYRRLPDTKPHYAHPNHLFVLDGVLWVTKLRTSRASCVTGSLSDIVIEAGMPHDGTPVAGRLTFTTTNGRVVRVDPATRGLVDCHDLKDMMSGPDLLGWCRGVCPDPRAEDSLYVAFSRSRRTRWKEFGFRVKQGYEPPPSQICRYDLAAGEMTGQFEVVPEESLVLFQLMALPERLWV